jgi:hypothetical protein
MDAGRLRYARGLMGPGKRTTMCYNCGCNDPNASSGNSKNITNQTFEEAAKAAHQTPEEAKKHTLELLERQLSNRT